MLLIPEKLDKDNTNQKKKIKLRGLIINYFTEQIECTVFASLVVSGRKWGTEDLNNHWKMSSKTRGSNHSPVCICGCRKQCRRRPACWRTDFPGAHIYLVKYLAKAQGHGRGQCFMSGSHIPSTDKNVSESQPLQALSIVVPSRTPNLWGGFALP